MRIKWLGILMLIVLGAGIALSVAIIKNTNLTKVDLVAINEVVNLAEKNWGKVTEELFVDSDLKQPFSIIDHMDNVVYATPGHHFTSLYDAIKQKDTVIDLEQENEIIGKIIIRNNEQQIIKQMKDDLVLSISVIFGLAMVMSMINMAYLYQTLVRPFHQLQKFAANVARGHLDLPLHMVRNNYFGAFTESFDLMREELEAARQREYESNRSKKELVATLSHDIQTPVASIKAVSELMMMQAKDEKVMKQITTIHAKAEQIHLLVTDMFHATLEELKQLTITVTEESSEVLTHMIDGVNNDGNIVCGPISPCILIMDPMRLQQVLDNIISNSYKYAGTKVIISSKIIQGFLELQIKDFGPGINEEELPLLFNKYFRGKNVEGKKGSGLGLYISKYFMKHMGGQIHCYNRPDGFTVMLKIKLA